jgi:hypothetical protein
VAEAQAAKAAGADAVIAQGIQAGGHVRGTVPALELLERVRATLGAEYPVFLAGGIAERSDVAVALEAGAQAAVAGTRFLLSPESSAHADYKKRLLDADRTILTELFGLSWPAASHRVVPNAATDAQVSASGAIPLVNRAINRATSVTAKHTPDWMLSGFLNRQHPTSKFLTPLPPTDELSANLIDAGPLYAGETVSRIHDLMPVAHIVDALTP